jgi:hypothetical protein
MGIYPHLPFVLSLVEGRVPLHVGNFDDRMVVVMEEEINSKSEDAKH